MNRNIVLFPALLVVGGALFGACSSNTERPVDPNGGKSDTGIVPDDDASTAANCEDVEKFIQACGQAETGASKSPAYLYFVLDGSGSMIGDKWDAAVEALDAVFDDMHTQADPNLSAGILVFEDTLSTGKYPGSKDIAPAFVDDTQYQRLRNRIDKADASGGTPTYAALKGAYSVMSTYAPVAPTPEGGNRVVVLMSDGEPTDDAPGCIKLAKQYLAADPSIKTFSVGIGQFPGGSGYDPEFMGDLAVAGGTPATPTCKPSSTSLADVCHFQVTPGSGNVQKLKADFIEAINKIRGLAVGCEYTIDKTGTFDPARTNVIFTDGNGKKHCVAKDENNGWSFDDPNDPTKIILNGQACGDASSDVEGSVKILIGCKSN